MVPTAGLRADRRTAIYDAVFELLGEVGYDRMTMDAVAARAKASKATLYRTWPSKPELVAEAIMHHFGDSPASPDTGSLRGDLLATVSMACSVASSPDGDVISGLMTAAGRDPDLSSTMQRCMYDAKHAMFQSIVEQACARGELCSGADAGVLHEVLHALILSRRMWETGDLDGVYAEHVVDRVLIPVLMHSPPAVESEPAVR